MVIPILNIELLIYGTDFQGGDSAAGKQALPVGKIIEANVLRKDNQEIIRTFIMCEWYLEKIVKKIQI